MNIACLIFILYVLFGVRAAFVSSIVVSSVGFNFLCHYVATSAADQHLNLG